MSTIDRIIALMEQKGINGAELSRACSLGNAKFYQWKAGSSEPSAKSLAVIAEYLNVSVDYLLGNEQKNKPTPNWSELSEKDKAILDWFYSLPEEKRQAILTVGDAPKELGEK